ncbi:MAG: YgiQ family radical SAM protein [Clostridia bacterium]|nr:YgiQ family radical SAM protein [Clostridia bacterium]
MPFLPVNKKEMKERGWDRPDFVYVCGDAYVDHSSFGAAIICRVLESHGYKVCMLAQPDWHSTEDFMRFGEPRLAFLVSAGNIDSMVNHYTVAKKKRAKDAYSPGGKAGLRPDRATIVYCNKIREAYKNAQIVIGGVEASLRRLSHYDYWDNKVRRSILLDSGADLLLYGMGEHQIVELADALNSGLPLSEITFLRGSVYKTRDKERIGECIWLPTYEETASDKKKYAESFMLQYGNTDFVTGKTLAEEYREGIVVQNPPSPPLMQEELDSVYALPYMRTYHPMYEKDGGVPAIEEIKFSLSANRGCFGNCSFCAIVFHQGRIVTSRSDESLIDEAKLMTEDKDFKGYIHDVGGPTANFMQPACDKQLKAGACRNRQCLFPEKCPNLRVDHKKYLRVLRKLRALPKVKKVFIRSGIRYDYLIYDKDESFFNELCKYHISGQLRVAPEHVSDRVLSKMGKPSREVYERFVKRFDEINKKYGLDQYCVPYLMSSHPGSDLKAAIELAEYLRDIGHMPEQVQDFYPTPGTLSTCMYYTEIDPRDGKKVYVPKNPHEKAMQRALMQYRVPSNYDLVKEALIKGGREDLIGYTPRCLIRPERPGNERQTGRAGRQPKAVPAKQGSAKGGKKKTIRNVHKKQNK